MNFGRRHIGYISAALFLFVGSAVAQPQQPPSVAISTIQAELKPIVRTMDFVGRVEAVEQVEIHARVNGYLDAVLFTEGALVKEGDPLFTIEKGLFEADLEQAQGELERSKAALQLATLQRQRAEELLQTKAGTVVARDQAVAAELQARGAILTNQANLSTAKINLGYTDITSPINGRIGRTNVTKGNVVGPESGPLSIIVSQDPIYVTFPVSQRELLKAQQKAQQTGKEVDLSKIKVKIRFSDGAIYDQTGTIDFLDVRVNRATDTVLARAVMPNPVGTLVDGQLVRVMLEGAKPEERVLVPQAALVADQSGPYVFVVEDGKAAMRRVTMQSQSGTNVVIESGLSGGEQVIVDGLQKVRPGTPVVASPAPPLIKAN